MDLAGEFRSIREINNEIRRLNLSAYAPLRYVLLHKQAAYDAKYSTQIRGGESFFRQVDREESLVHLLRVNVLKRMPIEQKCLAGKTVHSIGAGTLLVCLSEKITAAEVEPVALGIVDWYKAQAPAGESTMVFRDSTFADDVAKTNLTAILQQYGLENVRSL